MARKVTTTGTTPAAIAYDSLTAKGQALMLQIGTWNGSFFDGGIAAHSGAWGEVLTNELDLDALGVKSTKSVAGVLNGTAKAGLWDVAPGEAGDDSDFWSLTELGAEVAHHAAALAAPKPAVKVCRKDASHGEHRVTKTGSYCYACDRIAAEAAKAARAAAKVEADKAAAYDALAAAPSGNSKLLRAV